MCTLHAPSAPSTAPWLSLDSPFARPSPFPPFPLIAPLELRLCVCPLAAQETGISRRLLENFAEIASGSRFAPVKKPLAGAFDTDVLPVVDAEKIHIIAIQVQLVGGGLLVL